MTIESAPVPSDRRRRIVVTGLSSGGARLASFGVTLVALPLVVRELGADQFGVYVALAALVNVVIAIDLGLGNALMTEVARFPPDESSHEHLARLVSSAVLPLLLFVLLVGGALALLTQTVDLTTFLNTPPDLTPSELSRLLLLAFIPYVLSLPLGVVVRVRYGLREGHRSHGYQMIGYALQLGLLLVAVALDASLGAFVLLLGIGAALGYALDVTAMIWRRPWMAPRPSAFEWVDARRLLGTGGLFLVLGVSAGVAFQTDALVTSHFLGTSDAAVYGVTFQLVVVCPLALSLFLNVLWPAYSEAIAAGDLAWVRRAFRRSLLTTVPIAVVAAVGFALVGADVVAAWAGEAVRPPQALVLAGSAYIVANAVAGPIAMLLNGLGLVGPQAVAAVTMATANITLSIVWVQSFGIQGPLIATVVTQIVFSLVPLAVYLWWVLRSDARLAALAEGASRRPAPQTSPG